MNARIERDAELRAALGNRLPKPATWSEWWWGTGTKPALTATDVANKPWMRLHFAHMLDHTEPPAVFKPSEVAACMSKEQVKECGFEKWEEAIPAVYELAFELRAMGDCEILRKGVVIPDDMGIEDLDGPIRIRRVEM